MPFPYTERIEADLEARAESLIRADYAASRLTAERVADTLTARDARRRGNADTEDETQP